MPFYPPALQAGPPRGNGDPALQGQRAGDVLDVEATGPQRLREAAAVQNVRNWKFAWARPCTCQVKTEVVFVYGLCFEDWLNDDGPTHGEVVRKIAGSSRRSSSRPRLGAAL